MLSRLSKNQQWIVQDKFIVILNSINKNRFKHQKYDFLTEEKLRLQIIKYMKLNNITDLEQGVLAYRRDISVRIEQGEVI